MSAALEDFPGQGDILFCGWLSLCMFEDRAAIHGRFSVLDAPVNDRLKHEAFAKFTDKHLVHISIQLGPDVVVPHQYAKEAQPRIIARLDFFYGPRQRFKALEIITGGKHWDNVPIRGDKTAGHEKAQFRWGINDHHIPMAAERI